MIPRGSDTGWVLFRLGYVGHCDRLVWVGQFMVNVPVGLGWAVLRYMYTAWLGWAVRGYMCTAWLGLGCPALHVYRLVGVGLSGVTCTAWLGLGCLGYTSRMGL